MGNPLQQRRTPQDWAASSQVIEITEKICNFERLAGIVEADLDALDPDKLPPDWRGSVVSGRLGFAFADAQSRVPVLDGHVEVTIVAVCQRCLEPFQLPLAAELRWVLGGEKQAIIDDGYEIWELAEETLRPIDVVEEALIMAMPLAAVHVDDSTCNESDAAVEAAGERTRPFATLRSQMEDDTR